MGKPRNKSTAKTAAESEALELTSEAWRLHLQRTPERDIARLLGKPKTTIHRAIERGRQIFRADVSAEDNKARIEQRRLGLEAILAEAWANYHAAPDPSTLTICRQCESDLRKMYGDDAAEKSEVKVEGGVAFLPKDEMLAACQAAVRKAEGKVV